jgi:vacuolar-type H+-ATPase subunit E/Vma4
MEELKSTDVLDKEILEDARKKALRILRQGDERITTKSESWERKTQRAIDEVRKKYEERISKEKNEIMARLPLDKRRIRSDYVENVLQSAMNSYLNALPREKLLSLVERELSLRASQLPLDNLTIRYRHLSDDEAEKIIKKILPKSTWKKDNTDKAYTLSGTFPEIMIDSADMRVTASVDDASVELQSVKRAELISALLGEEALND